MKTAREKAIAKLAELTKTPPFVVRAAFDEFGLEPAGATPTGRVRVELTHAEALVLFDWLARTNGAIPTEDASELLALRRVEGQLEATLPDVLDPDYKRLVDEARAEVRGHPSHR